MSEYSEKLKNPRWQKKRLEILERDGFNCQNCHDDKNTLHMHHKQYFKDKEPWEVPGRFLITLCEKCHEKEKSDYPIALNYLIDILKEKGFMSYDIAELGEAIYLIKILKNQTLWMTIHLLHFFITNQKRLNNLYKVYLDIFRKTKKKRNNNG